MAKSNSKTRRAQRRGTKRGGGWFSSSKSANTPKPNPRRDVDFREVLAKYANFYNARLTFKKKYLDFSDYEKDQLDDAKIAETYGPDTPMPTNIRLFRGLASSLQTGKEVAGTAALGARLAASGVASGISSGAKYGWSGMKSAASATRNAAKKTTGWFSRKGEQFTNATRKKFNAAANKAGRAATAVSRAVESPETTADRLLTELESNPSNAARNSKIAQVRAQLSKVRMGWGSGSKKAELERRLRGVVSTPAAAPPASQNNSFRRELANVQSGKPLFPPVNTGAAAAPAATPEPSNAANIDVNDPFANAVGKNPDNNA